MHVVIQFDGGVDDQNGAGAAIVFDPDGRRLAERARYVCGGTSNVYEYVGLVVGMRLARELGATSAAVWGDSELVVRHVGGTYECRKPHLRAFLDQALALVAEFDQCTVQVFPKSGKSNKRRNLNEPADALARECKRLRRDIDRVYDDEDHKTEVT